VYIDYIRRSRSSSCRLLRPINCQTYITLHYFEYSLWTDNVDFAHIYYIQCDLFDCCIFNYEIMSATLANTLLFIFVVRCYASVAYVVMRCVCVCLSVCVSVTFVHSVKMNKHIFKIFSPSGSHTILVFRTKQHGNILMGTPPNGGVKRRWSR